MMPGSLKIAAEAASMLASIAAVRLKHQLPVFLLCDFLKGATSSWCLLVTMNATPSEKCFGCGAAEMNCQRERQVWRIEVIQLPRKVIMVNSVWVHREASPCRITSYWAGAEQALGQTGSLLFITPSVEDKQGMWTWEQGSDYFTGRLLTTKDYKSLNISKKKNSVDVKFTLPKLWNN